MSGRVAVARRSMWVGPHQLPIISEGDRTLSTVHDDVHSIAPRILEWSSCTCVFSYDSLHVRGWRRPSANYCSLLLRAKQRSQTLLSCKKSLLFETHKRSWKPRLTVLARANSKLRPCSALCSHYVNKSGNQCLFFFQIRVVTMKLYATGTLITIGPIVPDPDEKWVWSSSWNENWQGKPKYSDKTWHQFYFAHHRIPCDLNRDWTRAAEVGSLLLTSLPRIMFKTNYKMYD
jgi:hypothetical protein